MLDERVRAVLNRLEAEEPRPPGVPVEPTTGRFLFSVCAPQADCEVLEIGGGHGYSTIWLAAGVRNLGGRVLSLERDHECIADWRRNIADAGLEETAELLEGDARETLPMIDHIFDVVFLDAANKQYDELFGPSNGRAVQRSTDAGLTFTDMTNDPEFLSEANKLDFDLDIMDAAEIDQVLDHAYTSPPDVIETARQAIAGH